MRSFMPPCAHAGANAAPNSQAVGGPDSIITCVAHALMFLFPCTHAGANSAPNSQAVGGPDSIISKARKFEAGNDYARAIETYLSIGTADTTNLDVLQQVGPIELGLSQSHLMIDLGNYDQQQSFRQRGMTLTAYGHDGVWGMLGMIVTCAISTFHMFPPKPCL